MDISKKDVFSNIYITKLRELSILKKSELEDGKIKINLDILTIINSFFNK